VVQNVHLSGGSLLGVSRGGPEISEIVDSLEVLNLSFALIYQILSSQLF
jgi:6-phosphofructokinase 1